jgi:hypothetical protein
MSIKSVKLREARNKPPAETPWIWLTREMLESDAFNSLSRPARRVIDRVSIEHMLHAGTANGDLAVTYDDFVKFGIRRSSIKTAIKEATDTGVLIITVKGRPSRGQDRWPTRYALGWLPLCDGSPAPNRWKAWRNSRPAGPIHGNIESSTKSVTRENGGNPSPLVPKAVPGAGTEGVTGKLAQTLISPVPKVGPGERLP